MNVHARDLRLAPLVAAGALAVTAWTADAAPAPPPEVSCTHSGTPANVVAFSAGTGVDTLKLERVGDAIRFSSVETYGVIKKGKRLRRTRVTPAVCAVTPTVHNTDRIEVTLSGEESQDLEVSLRGGAFAPGATAEADASSEVEIGIVESQLGGLTLFTAANGPDWFRFGSIGGVHGVNLNAQAEAASPDVDATMVPYPVSDPEELPGPDERAAAAEMGGGGDTVTASGGPEFDSPMDAVFFASGQSGNDTLLSTAPRFALIVGGGGNDTIVGSPRKGRNIIFAGQGDDVVTGGDGPDDVVLGPGRDRAALKGGLDIVSSRDGARDRVGCGGGKRDGVSRDRKDRLTGCEFRTLEPLEVGLPD